MPRRCMPRCEAPGGPSRSFLRRSVARRPLVRLTRGNIRSGVSITEPSFCIWAETNALCAVVYIVYGEYNNSANNAKSSEQTADSTDVHAGRLSGSKRVMPAQHGIGRVTRRSYSLGYLPTVLQKAGHRGEPQRVARICSPEPTREHPAVSQASHPGHTQHTTCSGEGTHDMQRAAGE